MTLGEKLAKLRRENNITQEQLAETLGVSRQAVSKWESNLTFPETEKLIQISRLYACSLDYLLREECEQTTLTPPQTTPSGWQTVLRGQLRERTSERLLFGLPLWQIGRQAHAIFAVGLRARGVVSVGLMARGMVSLGFLSLGIFSFGLLSLGLLAMGVCAVGAVALGSFALGIIAIGAFCAGVLAVGAISTGLFSVGGIAQGLYLAVGDYAEAMVAIGKTEAEGSLYRFRGTAADADLETVAQVLAEKVPWYLSWAKEIVMRFL